MANFIDNLTHGAAIGGGFAVNSLVGLTTLLGIIIHEIPHEMGDFAILLRSGFDRRQATKAQLVTGLGGVLGAALALYYSNSVHSSSPLPPRLRRSPLFRYIVGAAFHQRWFPLRCSRENSSRSSEGERCEVRSVSRLSASLKIVSLLFSSGTRFDSSLACWGAC